MESLYELNESYAINEANSVTGKNVIHFRILRSKTY